MQLEDEFGDIVAKALAGNGTSAGQLAHAAGLTERDVARIESYDLVPDAETIVRIAEALGLDARKLTQIARGEWEPMQHPSTSSGCWTGSGCCVRMINVPYGAYAENAYVLWCERSRKAAVVDPGGSVEQIAGVLQAENLSPELVLVTHAHGDHTGGLPELLRRYPDVTVVSSPVDHDSAARASSTGWSPAEDGTAIALGKLAITALATPGHTAGSVCYAVDGVCFVGDTLFAGSIGRPASSSVYHMMLASIRTKVLSLPADTILLPGHGPVTTVAEELEHNPFF